MPNFVEVTSIESLPPNRVKAFLIQGQKIALFHLEEGVYAIADTCSHDEASLSEGEIDGIEIECPRHGARFDITTGRNLTLPAVVPVKKYEVRIEAGRIFVAV